MIMNLGSSKDTCLKAYDFLAKHEGQGEETKEDGSHPGYEDRYAAIENFLKTYKPNPDRKIEGTKGKWKYNRDLNTLVFTPE